MSHWLGLPSVENFKGLDLRSLPMNSAYVVVNTTIDNVGVYSVMNDCYQCPYKLVKNLRAHEEVSWVVDTSEQASWKLMNFGNYNFIANHYRGGLLCQEKPIFGDFGVYRMNVGACVVDTEVPPVQPYLPLLPCSLILLAVFVIYATMTRMVKCKTVNSIQDPIALIQSCEDQMKTLNILRGLLMIIIIFATSGGGGYSFINKRAGGVSIPDVAFNALAWTIGVHIPYAVDIELLNGRRKRAIAENICLRSLLLIISSLLIDSTLWSYSPENLWSPFKRIGIAYILAASTYTMTVKRFEKANKMLIKKLFNTTLSLLWSWIVFCIVLAMLVISMETFANFNCMPSPSFNHQRLNYSNIETEVSVVCDNVYTELANRVLVGDARFILDVNNYIGYSAGLLGTLSTILYTLIGLKTGVILSHFESHSERLKLCSIWATFFGIIGLALILVSHSVSINIWPIASIFLLSTMSTYILMVVYWWAEIRDQSISPVASMGSSYILIFFGHLLFSKSIPFSFNVYLNTHFWRLIQNIWTLLLWVIISDIVKTKNVKINI